MLVKKTVLAVTAWIVFAVLLIGRVYWGWRGNRAIIFTLAGVALLVIAYFGSRLVLQALQ